jgi:hypothetical protein
MLLRPLLDTSNMPLLIFVNKGIEIGTRALTLEIIADTCGPDVAKAAAFIVSYFSFMVVIRHNPNEKSGPSFAAESELFRWGLARSADRLQSSKGSQHPLLLPRSQSQRQTRQPNCFTSRISDGEVLFMLLAKTTNEHLVIPTVILLELNFLVRLRMSMRSQPVCQMDWGIKIIRERVRDVTKH